MFRHTIDDYAFEILYDSNLNISVIDRLLCEEYATIIKKDAVLFEGHKIISSPEILYKILCDGITHSNANVTVTTSVENYENTIGVMKRFNFNINVNAIYVTDNMLVTLLFVDKHITPKQVIERIDLRFEHYIPELKNDVQKIKEEFEKKLNTTAKICDSEHNMMTTKFEKVIEKATNTVEDYVAKLQKDIKDITVQNAYMSKELKMCLDNMPIYMCDYALCTPDYYGINHTLIPSVNFHVRLGLRNNLTSLLLSASGGQYYIAGLKNNNPLEYNIYNDKLEIIDFNREKFKYFTNLENVSFSDFDFPNLEFMTITDKLHSITLNNIPSLKSIKHLSLFPNLEQITISKSCKITDLHELSNCKNLKTLSLPTGTNTGCFPQEVPFEIKMI